MIKADDVVEPPQPLANKASARPKLIAATAFRADRPEFIRLPKPGKRCLWTGLTRSSMNALVLGPEAPVKSVVLASRGKQRGVRLVSLLHLISHLNELMERQATGKEAEND